MATAKKKAKREPWLEGFYSGYAAALSAALYGQDGASTEYIEAMRCIDTAEFLAWAKRTDDMELPRIKEAIRCIREQKAITRRIERLERKEARATA